MEAFCKRHSLTVDWVIDNAGSLDQQQQHQKKMKRAAMRLLVSEKRERVSGRGQRRAEEEIEIPVAVGMSWRSILC